MFILFSCFFDQKFTIKHGTCKLLIETQPTYVSKVLLMDLIDHKTLLYNFWWLDNHQNTF